MSAGTDNGAAARPAGMPGPAAGRLNVLELGRMAYEPALRLQEDLVARRKRALIPDTLALVEHEPVYTLGRGATEADVLVPRGELARRGIAVVRTGRGGQVTYHGPGQLVGYPIVHLGDLGLGVVEYITGLERTLVAVLSDFGVAATTDPVRRGVWIGRDKIAAIGVRVTGQVTMHGFALNVSPDLSPYAGIVPCGLRDRGVTALARLAPGVAMASVVRRTVLRFAECFGYADVRPGADSPNGGVP